MGAALPVAMGLQVGGSLLAAQAAKDEGEMSARYYDMLGMNSDLNADLTVLAGDRSARDVQDRAATESGVLRDNVKRTEGAQDVALAANGTGGSVTAEDIARDTRAKARLDELAIRYNADTKSGDIRRGAAMDAMNLRFQGGASRVSGNNARATGKARSIVSLVGGAAQVANTAYLGYGK